MEDRDTRSTQELSRSFAKSRPTSNTDITKQPYTHCNTRILDLRPLNLPTAPDTPDSTLRSIYKSHISNPANQPAAHNLQSAITSLTTGIAPPIAFPTETVYGLGADATNPASISGIFAAKGRPADNPLIVHVSSTEHLERCLGGTPTHSAIPEVYKDLVQRFWPGPLTILIPVPKGGKGVRFAPNVHPGQKTIGFRVPSNPYARFLIANADRPIAGPSANSSGKPSPTTAQHVYEDLKGKVNFILDGGACDVGVESTVVDGLSGTPVILRPGGLSRGDLRRWGTSMGNVWAEVENAWDVKKKGTNRARPEEGEGGGTAKRLARSQNGVDTPPDVFESPATRSPATGGSGLHLEHDGEAAPRAPGMKYKHYAPSGRMFLFEAGQQGSLSALYDELGLLTETAERGIGIVIDGNGSRTDVNKQNGVLNPSASSRTAVENLKIGILISTSWPALPSLLKTWTKTYPEWAAKKHMRPEPHDRHTQMTLERDVDKSHKRSIELHSIELGQDSISIARNLFAALRKCDELGCETIFAEAPSEETKTLDATETEDPDDTFETVLERMRKAASEVVQG